MKYELLKSFKTKICLKVIKLHGGKNVFDEIMNFKKTDEFY